MRTVILHSAAWDENWAHYYFYRDPDFLRGLEEQGLRLVLSREVPDGKGAAAALFLDAGAAGAGTRLAQARLVANVRRRLRLGSIPGRRAWDPETCRMPFAFHPPGHPARFDAAGAPRVLLAMEGVMHAPDSHNPVAHAQFDAVLTWNPAFVDSPRVEHYRITQPGTWTSRPRLPFADRRLVTSISADKRIAHPLELYTARREAIAALARAVPDSFEFYGMGWSGLPADVGRAFRGEAKDKGEIFARFRFALAYENASVPGYLTEKIFDVMRSGCVPVYLGAPDVAGIVPAECFVDRRAFRDDGELLRYLAAVSERDYARRLEAIDVFLRGAEFGTFLGGALARRVAAVVGRVSR